MSVIAKLNYLRIAPRKVRLVVDLMRGKSVEEAQTILNFTVKKAAQPLLKLLKSAAASARHNFQQDQANLYISKITVDEGPKYKRWMPRARGQASEIQKKTSHVTLVLDEIIKKPRKIQKRMKKLQRVEKVEKTSKIEKPRLKPKTEAPKPKIEKELQPFLRPPAKGGPLRRIFRRKAF